MNKSSVVLLNTATLYFKLFATTVISLYLTRVVLQELGASDFGLYNLIGGVVAILAFLNSALMSSTQRFLSVALGQHGTDSLHDIFQSSLIIHALLSLLVLFVLEFCSLFLFDGFLNIEADRLHAAVIVYHVMVFSTVATILAVPYNAAINAHEDLWFFALVETLCKAAQLLVVFMFRHLAYDSLVVYTGWVAALQVLNIAAKFVWCYARYDECRNMMHRHYTRSSIGRMLGFTGWNTLGSLAMVGRNQGVAVVLNLFFGTAVNAAYGIANQVNAQLVYFSQMMTASMTPQIMKSYGEGDVNRMLRLSVLTSKMAFLLSAVFALPLILNMGFVIEMWLGSVPDHTLSFCCLTIYVFLAMQLYPGLTRAIQAKGDIRLHQIVLSLFLLLPLPLGYCSYRSGVACETICYYMIAAQTLTLSATVYIAHVKTGLPIAGYSFFVLKAVALFFALLQIGNAAMPLACGQLPQWGVLVTSSIALPSVFSAFYYALVLDSRERSQIKNVFNKLIRR